MKVTKDQARAFLQAVDEDNLRTTAHFKAVLGNFGLPYYPLYRTEGYHIPDFEEEVAKNFCEYLRALATAIEE